MLETRSKYRKILRLFLFCSERQPLDEYYLTLLVAYTSILGSRLDGDTHMVDGLKTAESD